MPTGDRGRDARLKRLARLLFLGRVMGAGELRRIAAAKNVVKAYQSRKYYRDQNGNENWVDWTNKTRIWRAS